MSNMFRRFEILLPLRFNDGQAVPGDLMVSVLETLEHRFGAVSSESQTIRGIWHDQGQSYRDDLVRVFVDTADTPENIAFFREFKEQLKVQFGQLDIWLTTYPLDVL